MRNFGLSMLLLAVIGCGLMAAGFFSGASTTLYIDRSGLHMGDETASQTTENSLDAFTDIEIDIAAADIKIVPSDAYGLEINSQDSLPITYTNENGKLHIKQNDRITWQIFNFDLSEDSVVIYYPENQSLGDIRINAGSGNIQCGDIDCQSLRLGIASGDVDIKQVTAQEISIDGASGDINLTDSQAENLRFALVSGTLNAVGMHSNSLITSLTSGNVVLDGRFLGSNQISVISGDVDMRIDGAESDYNRDISVISGTVTVNGVKNHENVSNSTPNSLRISLTSGEANIQFAR